VAVTFDLVAYHHVVHADDILEDEISMRIVRGSACTGSSRDWSKPG
jgi:hypothetical protein